MLLKDTLSFFQQTCSIPSWMSQEPPLLPSFPHFAGLYGWKPPWVDEDLRVKTFAIALLDVTWILRRGRRCEDCHWTTGVFLENVGNFIGIQWFWWFSNLDWWRQRRHVVSDLKIDVQSSQTVCFELGHRLCWCCNPEALPQLPCWRKRRLTQGNQKRIHFRNPKFK